MTIVEAGNTFRHEFLNKRDGISVLDMATERQERRRVHFGLALAELICVSAFIFELKRALGGNELSWAYVFEWPIFGGYAIYMWRKLLNEQPMSEIDTVVTEQEEAQDPELLAWNEYLEQAHAHDRDVESKKRRP
jgi:hypothetical protein